MSIDRPRLAIAYIDGGIEYNNASEVALIDAWRLWPNCIEFGLVSIGTSWLNANSFKLSEGAAAYPGIEDIRSYLPNAVKRDWNIAKKSGPGVKALIKNGKRFGRTCDQFRGRTSTSSTSVSVK